MPINHFKNNLKTSSILKCVSLATMAMSIASGNAYALPTGAQVESGSVSVHQDSASSMIINQSTDRAATNWQGFDILKGEAVRINQPGSGSQSLNRVLGGKMTEIYGKLSSNGHVVIVNGSGVFFGGGSEVNVAGLVASTADIQTADFMAGKMNFSAAGKPDASIVNEGSITAAEGGLVALVGPSVRNDGIIVADKGTVALAGGQTATIDMYGDGLYSLAVGKELEVKAKDQNGNDMDSAVENNGTISAKGGKVLLTAKAAKNIVDNVINNTGVIEATAAHVEGGAIVLDGGSTGNVRVAGKLDASGKGKGQKGGKVTVTGDNITIAGNAVIDASGNAAGGEVRIGGDYQGQGDLQHANYVTVEKGALIDVSAIETGDAGKAIIWSDTNTKFFGDAYATAIYGAAGLVEVSSKGEIEYDAFVDVSSAYGAAGMLLLDPTNININNIFAAAIAITLTLGGDVTLSTPVAGVQAGNINVNSDINWIGSGDLTLNAINNINVNNDIRSFWFLDSGNNGQINLNAGNNLNVNGSIIRTLNGDINVNAINTTLTGSVIQSGNGNININNSGIFSSTAANSIFNDDLGTGGVSLRQSVAGNIQNAIDAVGTTGSDGALLTLGAGTFDQTFVIDQGDYTVTGQGEGVTIIKPTSLAGTPLVNLTGPWAAQFYSPIVLARGANNINVSNVTIDGTAVGTLPGTVGNTPLVYENAGGNVNSITTRGGAGSTFGMFTFASSDKGHAARTVNVNDLNSIGAWWSAAQGMGNLSTFNIANSDLNGNAGQYAAVYLNGAAGSATNNIMVGGATGGVGFYDAHDVAIANNIIVGLGLGTTGIYDSGVAFGVAAASDVVLNNNIIMNSGTGIYGNGGHNWTIKGNTLSAVVSNGTGVDLNNMTGTNIVGGPLLGDINAFGNFNTGIRVTNSDVTVTNNTFVSNATAIALNNADNSDVQNNTIIASATGINADNSDNVTFTDNTISFTSQRGILVNSSDNVTIDGTTLTANPIGIEVVDSGITLDGNSFTGGVNGLTVSGASSSLAFGADANIFTGQTSDFIRLLNNGLQGVATYIGGQKFDLTGTAELAGGLNDANSFVLENRLTHATDNSSLGLLWWNADNLYATGSIQPFIDAAKAFNFHQVNVDNGTYKENLTIDGFNGLTLTGGNRNVVIQPTTASTNLDMLSYRGFTHGHSGIVHVRNSSGVELNNMTIDGSQVAGGWIDASYAGVVAHNSDVTLDHMTVENIFGDGLAWNDGAAVSTDSAYGVARNLTVENSILQNLQNYGVIVAGANQNYTVQNSTIDMTPIVGHASDYWPFGIATIFGASGQITGNMISNLPAATSGAPYTSAGVFLLQAGATNISGNTLSGTTGVYDSGSTGALTVSNNKISNSFDGIFIDSHTGAVNVASNMINAAAIGSGEGVHFLNTIGATASGNTINNFDIGIHVDGSNNAVVSGNVLTSNITGIRVNPSSNVVVDGNVVNGGITGVTFVGGNNNTVKNGTISNTVNAIVIDGSTNSDVNNNTISNSSNNAITVMSSSTGAVVRNNTIANSSNDGIRIQDSANSRVRNNTLTNTGRDAILVTGAANIEIDNNDILATGFATAAGRDGISVRNSNGANIHDNLINAQFFSTGAGRYGINLFSSNNASIVNNEVSASFLSIASQGDAIHVEGSNNALISGNDLLAGFLSAVTNGNGIYVTSSRSAQITGNVINASFLSQGAAGHGILAENSTSGLNSDGVVITGNSITADASSTAALLDGIHVDNSAGGALGALARISGNTVNRVNGDGIESFNTNGVRINNNTIDLTGGHGILANLVSSVNGNDVNNAGIDGINLYNAANFTASNNSVTNSGHDGIHVLDSFAGTLDTNIVTDNTRDGVWVRNSDNTTISNSTILDNGRYGVRVRGSDNVDILNNNIRRNITGIFASNSDNADIRNNTIRNNSVVGIDLVNSDGFDITSNNIALSGIAGIRLDDANNGVIGGAGALGNNIHDNPVGVLGTNSAFVTVRNNTIADGTTGVDFANGNNIIVRGNDIANQTTGVLFNNVDNSRVRNNNITKVVDGIVADLSDSLTVDGNIINASFDGVRIDNATSLDVDNNTITAGYDGVNVDGSTTGVIQNNLITSGRDGIHVTDSSSFSVLANVITNAGRDGVRLRNAFSALVNGNTINGSAHDGIHVEDSAFADITSNSIINSGRDGIHILNAFLALVDGNTTNDSGRNGIWIRNSDFATINNNTVHDNARDGIRVRGSDDVVVTNNDIRRNLNGIYATNSDDLRIQDNTVRNNTLIGIELENSDDARIRGNLITLNDTGVSLNDSDDAVLRNNTIRNNTTGLDAFNSDNLTLVNNTIRNNTFGARILNALGVFFTGNSFVNNTTGADVTDSAFVSFDGNTFTNSGLAVNLNNADGASLTNNNFDSNNIGVQTLLSDDLVFTSNNFLNNTLAVTLGGSDDALFTSNSFTGSVLAAALIDSDRATFSGDIFTSNTVGIDLNNSVDTGIFNVTIASPLVGTGIQINNGSSGTLVQNLNISGGNIGIRISDPGSSMSFAGSGSQFSNMDFYFVLENGAMNGATLNASNQFFDGVQAFNFTFAQLNAAEAKTIDFEDGFAVGDVFYRSFAFALLNELDQDRSELYREGLFSYAGKTIVNDLRTDPFSFQVNEVNLSLLGAAGANAGGGAPSAAVFAGLAPAAGGSDADFANLSPAAGGDDATQLASLAPSAGPSGDCGNNFLSAGFAPGFSAGSCSVQ